MEKATPENSITIDGLTFVVTAEDFKPGEIDINPNIQHSYDMMQIFYKDLCEIEKAKHEHKLATYGFFRRNLYLAKFRLKNYMFRLRHPDLSKE